MKIGIDVRTLMDKQYSGIAIYVWRLLEAIFKLDHDNQYILYYNSAKDVKANLPTFNQANVSWQHTNYPNKIFNYLLQKTFHYPKLDRIIGGVDVFWAPHLNFISLSNQTKKIITVHDLSFLRYPEFFNGRKNIWHRALGVRDLLRRFDQLIAVSENTKEDIVDLIGIAPEKIKVIHSGLDEEFRELLVDDPELERVRQKHKLPSKFILYLGTLEPRKNIISLIRAYENLRKNGLNQVKLVLAGGRGWKFNKILRTAQHSKFSEDIIFLDYIEDKDKVALYNLAKIFVYPSFYEGFGFPPLEAMACGTPVISSFVSSLPEILGNAALLVNPDDPKSLAKAMENFFLDSELYLMYKQKGIERARKFNWPQTAQEYLDFFEKEK